MNRNQRKYGRPVKRDDTDGKSKNNKFSNDEIEEVFPPRYSKRTLFKTNKPMTNRCCHISPPQKDVEQLTEIDDNFSDLIKQQYDFDAIIPDRLTLSELKKALCKETTKIENSSQYAKQTSTSSYVETFDGSQWRNVDNTVELEQFLNAGKEDTFTSTQISFDTIQISDVPRVKIIAEKFSKFTKNNVELRKLEEKVVCIEYDIFSSDVNYEKPFQTMRAYFSVKPMLINNNAENVKLLPSTIIRKFDIADDDLGKLNEREIEIIDAKISDNKPYLDDLKKVLKRKQALYAKKKKSTLDLKSLYEMAKRESPSLDDDFSNTNLLSKAELEEIKELITKKCASSIHGISRRTVKCNDRKNDINVISQSIYEELVRNEQK